MLDKRKALKILAEVERRKPIDFLSGPLSFKEQNDFITDPAERKFALTCRRAGKSYAGGIMLMDTCLKYPGVTVAYCGLTRDSAKNVIIPHLREIKKNYKIQCRFYKSPAAVQFPNGSTILFFGLNDTNEEREKLLGQHYKLAIIDECASYTIDLKETIEKYIEPMLWDERGQLVMIGTPGNLRNYFCEVSEGRVPGWSGHKWLADKNPKTKDKYLEEVKKKREQYPNIDKDSSFQQHYLGLWTIDVDKILYKYTKDNLLNLFSPKHDKSSYTYILGLDLGWEDQNAFVVCAYHKHEKCLYILETYAESHMLLDMTINKINELKKKYNISVYVIDSANKAYVEELRYRTRIPFIPATKPEKIKYIHMMNSDLICNKIKVIEPACQSLLEEWKTLSKIEESHKYETAVGNQKDHNADAALYAWRYSFHYNHEDEPEIINPNSEQAVEKFWDQEMNRINSPKEWWEAQ